MENFQSCISFYSKNMHSWWDYISIDRNNRGHAKFIVCTIKYNKYCATKLSFPDMWIIDYLGIQQRKLTITFMLINSDLMRLSAIIQALFIYINFLFRNVNGDIAKYYIVR